MRLLRHVLALLLIVSLTAYGLTQDPPPKDDPAKKFKLPPLKFGKIRVGFEPYEKSNWPYYKSGFWTPVRVQLLAGEKEIRDGQLLIGTNDNEDVNTTTRTLFNLDATTSIEEVTKNTKTIVSYVMPGNMSAPVNISAQALDRIFPPEGPIDGTAGDQGKVDLTGQLYLTLPTRIKTLRKTLLSLSRGEVQNEPNGNINANIPPDETEEASTWPRLAAFEKDAEALPGMWKGYQGVDIIILTTQDRKFLESIMRPSDLSRLEAIVQWVRGGGRLIISVCADKQNTVSQLLQCSAWKPALPVKLPDDSGDILANAPKRLEGVEKWAGVIDARFLGKGANGKVPIAQLDHRQGPAPDWEVFAKVGGDDPRPVLTRVSYGRGQIIFVAFALDDQSPFSQWESGQDKGWEKFWTKLIRDTVAPRLAPAEAQNAPGIPLRRGSREQQFNNLGGEGISGPEGGLASVLNRTLTNFNVKIVPFGWVALFIFIYILVVGPLDYLLLKYVFKRLELTWITFPVVVFAVSLAAYFTAYAIKGKELRINQVDLLDFDLRTQIDNNDHKAKPFVYGQTFFTVLSPHIHNYTIGLEPNPAFWGQAATRPMSADMLTWLGARAGAIRPA